MHRFMCAAEAVCTKGGTGWLLADSLPERLFCSKLLPPFNCLSHQGMLRLYGSGLLNVMKDYKAFGTIFRSFS